MTIRTIFHAPDGEQFPSRGEAQRYVRALEFLAWLGPLEALPTRELAKALAERWYLHDRLAPPTRGKPLFTGATCPTCGGQMELINGEELCVPCNPKLATRLREEELKRRPASGGAPLPSQKGE